MFDVQKLNERALPAVVSYGGAKFRIEYSAGEKARSFEKALQKMAETPEEEAPADGGRRQLIEALAGVLLSWEVTSGGKKVPIEPEAMDALPVPTAFYSVLAQRIGEELANGGKAQRARS